ncbi:hypothetical protein BC792_102188 [Sphingobacterium allocomposti]|uniref:Uncharacterized protein n=1 Tax=Sphingobacterium allocomposti TaxID=415956 RepID=A0A5S5DRW3_9SPHI|nr:hypothetical protein BC792_102188 [Sphingobacterium composti Yoo et al. 2007 non Ten et al. 2007]
MMAISYWLNKLEKTSTALQFVDYCILAIG